MKAWIYIKNDCDQETVKEYSKIVQIIVKDDRRKAIAWRSVLVRWHVITYQTKKQYKFSVCISYLVCILYPVCSLQSAFCTDRIGIAVLVRASLKSGPKYWSSKKNSSETILAAMIDMWTVCWRAHEEKYNNRVMITLYQLKTDANAQLTNRATSDTLSSGHSVSWNEPATGPLGVNISASRFKLHFQKFRKCDLRLLFLLTHITFYFFPRGHIGWSLPTGTIFVTVFYSVELSHTVIFNYGRLHFNEYLSVYWSTFTWKTRVIWRLDFF